MPLSKIDPEGHKARLSKSVRATLADVPPEVLAARSLEAHVTSIVRAAPALSAEQRARLAQLLQGDAA